jgi:hypothetical protein
MQPAQKRPGAAITVEVTQSKEKVFSFVRELLNDIQADYLAERRANPRCPVCVLMEVIPFDSQGQQAGEAFTAVAKDISACGLSFLHNSAILDPYLLVRFPQSGQHKSQWIVLEVLRRRQIGPLWEIAGRSVAEPRAD